MSKKISFHECRVEYLYRGKWNSCNTVDVKAWMIIRLFDLYSHKLVDDDGNDIFLALDKPFWLEGTDWMRVLYIEPVKMLDTRELKPLEVK